MVRYTPPDSTVISRHRFTQPGIRVWLPVIMVTMLLLCGSQLVTGVRPLEVIALVLLLYVAISALVSVCEITVLQDGLMVNRLLLPERFIPWNAVDRVLVLSHEDGQTDVEIEIASIGIYEGLSPLNRLPGPVYGQGLRQTIIVTPDALEEYDTLLEALESHCRVIRQQMR